MVNENEIIEADPDELAIIDEYKNRGALFPVFFPLMTYDLVQCGYPKPSGGVMVARAYAGTNEQGQLMSGRGEFCKVEDVRAYIETLIGQDTQAINAALEQLAMKGESKSD